MSNADSLGDRIKKYEAVSNNTLTPRMPVIIRVDGKAFHTFTRGLRKPYSQVLIDTMVNAATETAKTIQGFKLAYIQSDEATFMLSDTDTLETDRWFGYEINKLVSITASTFTAHFNDFWQTQVEEHNTGPRLAIFDARAFNVPIEDVPNVFIWRQRDWERNSIQMLARSLYSQKEMHGKKVPDLHEMLHAKNRNWALLSGQLKNGTFIKKNFTYSFSKHNYDTIMQMITEVYPDE